MNIEYQKIAARLSKLALEANAAVIEMEQLEKEQLEQAENEGKPKVGQACFWVCSRLVANLVKWNNGRYDNERWEAGNVYLIEQEAVNAREFKLAVVRINREIVRLNKLDGFVADFTDHNTHKYYPLFDYHKIKWVSNFAKWTKAQFTFKSCSEETIESVIKSHAADFDIVQKFGAV